MEGERRFNSRTKFSEVLEVFQAGTLKGKPDDKVPYRLALMRREFGAKLASELASADVATFVHSRRAGDACDSTIQRDLSVLKQSVDFAKQNGVPLLEDIFKDLPEFERPRRRRYEPTPQDISNLRKALESSKNTEAADTFDFICVAALSAGEVFGLEWGNIHLDRAVWRPAGSSEFRPFAPGAVELLRQRPPDISGPVWKKGYANFRQVFRRAKQTCGCARFHLDDFQHRRIKQLSELGLTADELSAISGLKDVRSLARFCKSPSADAVAERIKGLVVTKSL